MLEKGPVELKGVHLSTNTINFTSVKMKSFPLSGGTHNTRISFV